MVDRVSRGLNPTFYLTHRPGADLRRLALGLIKPVVFAVLIAVIACYNGLSARGGADGVGRATTRTVVTCRHLGPDRELLPDQAVPGAVTERTGHPAGLTSPSPSAPSTCCAGCRSRSSAARPRWRCSAPPARASRCTLKTVNGLVRPGPRGDHGARRPGVDHVRGGAHAAAARVSYLFQGGALFDSMSVFENVAYRAPRARSTRAERRCASAWTSCSPGPARGCGIAAAVRALGRHAQASRASARARAGARRSCSTTSPPPASIR